MKKNAGQTKSRIVSAAWMLFYKNGYENTTIDDIVELSETSKGSFYHYFSSKDALLGSLSYLFDDKYSELEASMPSGMGPLEALLYMNHELFLMIENTVSVTMLCQLFSTQLVTKGEKYLLSPDRTYYKMLRKYAIAGKEAGIFKDELTVNDIIKAYALYERAIMYDWCLSSGNYSILQYSQTMLPLFMQGLCANR